MQRYLLVFEVKALSKEKHFSFIQNICRLLVNKLPGSVVTYEYLARKSVLTLQETIC